MKKLTIALAALLLLGGGLYYINTFAGDVAEQELDAMLAPKFKEARASYGGLAVNPAAGTVTLFDIATEQNGPTVREVSFTSEFEDLIAAAQGRPDYLHGLKMHVEGFELNVEGDDITINNADLDVDGIIDVKTMLNHPEAWLLEFLAQDDLHITMTGDDWNVRSEDMARDLGLNSRLIRMEDINLTLNRNRGALDATLELDSPELGRASITVDGDDDALHHFEIEVADLHLHPEDGARISMGRSTLTASGRMPFDQFENANPDDLFEKGTAVQWSVHLRDFMLEDDELLEEGLPVNRLEFKTLDHEFNYTVQQLETTLDFEGNLGICNAAMDLKIRSLDPPDADVQVMELQLDKLLPEVNMLLTLMPVPLTPEGDDGFTFSYSGPLEQLMPNGF